VAKLSRKRSVPFSEVKPLLKESNEPQNFTSHTKYHNRINKLIVLSKKGKAIPVTGREGP
jgi:hypothetical protein